MVKLEVYMGLKTKVAKTCYIAAKGIICQAPAAHVCWKTLKQSIKDITRDELPSLACKTFALYCGAPLTSVALVGSFCDPDTVRKLKTGGKFIVNVVASPFTGPAYIADTCLAGVETALFGEPLPILGNGPFLIN